MERLEDRGLPGKGSARGEYCEVLSNLHITIVAIKLRYL